MNDQETFDRVVKGIWQQGKKAVSEKSGSCRYRTVEGLKCAFGIILPDELYSSDMEGSDVESVLRFPGVREYFEGVNINLLMELQCAHDGTSAADFRKEWLDRCSDIARKYNLEMPTMKN